MTTDAQVMVITVVAIEACTTTLPLLVEPTAQKMSGLCFDIAGVAVYAPYSNRFAYLQGATPSGVVVMPQPMVVPKHCVPCMSNTQPFDAPCNVGVLTQYGMSVALYCNTPNQLALCVGMFD